MKNSTLNKYKNSATVSYQSNRINAYDMRQRTLSIFLTVRILNLVSYSSTCFSRGLEKKFFQKESYRSYNENFKCFQICSIYGILWPNHKEICPCLKPLNTKKERRNELDMKTPPRNTYSCLTSYAIVLKNRYNRCKFLALLIK